MSVLNVGYPKPPSAPRLDSRSLKSGGKRVHNEGGIGGGKKRQRVDDSWEKEVGTSLFGGRVAPTKGVSGTEQRTSSLFSSYVPPQASPPSHFPAIGGADPFIAVSDVPPEELGQIEKQMQNIKIWNG
jgi:hypothetical protein